MPDAGLARKETVVQAAVSAAGYPAPAVRACGGPDDGLGRAFMVMDRATGTPLLPGLDGVGALAAGVRHAAQIPEALASAMADLHALDPLLVRDQLSQFGGLPVTLPGLLHAMHDLASRCHREDLASAAHWLIEHPRPPAPTVICHGDLHPFNILSGDGRLTVLDWSACLLAPRAYDIAFTITVLAEPPLRLPGPLRSLACRVGRVLAARFVNRYEKYAAVSLDRADLRWHRAVVSLRALAEVAGWAQHGVMGGRDDHPWLAAGPALAAHLTSVTGAAVRPR